MSKDISTPSQYIKILENGIQYCVSLVDLWSWLICHNKFWYNIVHNSAKFFWQINTCLRIYGHHWHSYSTMPAAALWCCVTLQLQWQPRIPVYFCTIIHVITNSSPRGHKERVTSPNQRLLEVSIIVSDSPRLPVPVFESSNTLLIRPMKSTAWATWILW